MTDPAVDPSHCPRCGGPNDCAAVDRALTCWCYSVRMGPEALATLPASAIGAACLCRGCALAAEAHKRGI
jgi:Cysteine-rich CWC